MFHDHDPLFMHVCLCWFYCKLLIAKTQWQLLFCWFVICKNLEDIWRRLDEVTDDVWSLTCLIHSFTRPDVQVKNGLNKILLALLVEFVHKRLVSFSIRSHWHDIVLEGIGNRTTYCIYICFSTLLCVIVVEVVYCVWNWHCDQSFFFFSFLLLDS